VQVTLRKMTGDSCELTFSQHRPPLSSIPPPLRREGGKERSPVMRREEDEQRKEEIVGREKRLIKQAGHVAEDPNNKQRKSERAIGKHNRWDTYVPG